ncbi:MAG: DUF5666 domain-containing protein [Patescibacteria group bacterium]|nr:DUF5666 domain-containing protein [Patescibacteria group bacterium]MDD5554347.1 DUF5666 domain-containing protein [Patescibacteria group bacterium]
MEKENNKISNGVKKVLPIIILLIVVMGGGAFYGGMKYGQSKSPAASWGAGGGLANLSPAERQARFSQGGAIGAGGQRATQAGGGFASGEILSKDDQSVTVKLNDGGSRIVFLSGSTAITKSASSSAEDLKVGDQIMASGSQNSDGSLAASAIAQISSPK